MDDRDLLRYSRHILLDEIGIEGQEKLLSATVFAVGCGGLGAAALPYLAAAGIGHIVLADGDAVDDTNLQRQTAFGEADIGRNKAQTLAGRLKSGNSRCQTTALPRFLDEDALVEQAAQADIVLDCSDNFATRQAVNRVCVRLRKPLVSGAAVRFDGQLAAYRADLPGSPCYACLFDGETADDGACALFGVFAPLVGIIGTMQAAAALNILLDTGKAAHGVLQTYNALSGQWHTFAIPKDPGCRVCGGASA
ncbi:Sulfur carrier protein ThiS adenylyltransferase [Kingella potus]|uniref:Sulfur carrier protein ThiS adenylyltransferase n=1 Tax=Kingella potus TaxID=265175 RepID=A0A377R0T9_9NEIS|nr:HesA/MoeB/ThiF family protein [Kingella potus]STR00709.1 Sulfur carrier protein ThiS adenylyltransferase [Kingella potus]